MSTLTTREVMYMINDIEHTVAACKKVVNDNGFMDTLKYEHPDSYIALIASVLFMRSCGENI